MVFRLMDVKLRTVGRINKNLIKGANYKRDKKRVERIKMEIASGAKTKDFELGKGNVRGQSLEKGLGMGTTTQVGTGRYKNARYRNRSGPLMPAPPVSNYCNVKVRNFLQIIKCKMLEIFANRAHNITTLTTCRDD